jgi:HEAT repeat protein
MRALRDASPGVRANAAWALGRIEDGRALSSVVSLFGDNADKVREAAVIAAGRMDSTTTTAALIRVLRQDNSAAVRRAAAWALGQIGDSSALPAIRSAVKQEKNERVGRAMIRALMKSGERSETTLTELLNSDDPQVREAAVRGLAGGGSFNPWPWPEPRPRPFP